jgi:hypothetical protein
MFVILVLQVLKGFFSQVFYAILESDLPDGHV